MLRERRPERVIEEIDVPDWYAKNSTTHLHTCMHRASRLFNESLRVAVSNRRLPFNISAINDEMRKRDRRFHCQKDLDCTFSEFAKACV